MYKYNQVMHKICKQLFKSLFIWRMFYEVNKNIFMQYY